MIIDIYKKIIFARKSISRKIIHFHLCEVFRGLKFRDPVNQEDATITRLDKLTFRPAVAAAAAALASRREVRSLETRSLRRWKRARAGLGRALYSTSASPGKSIKWRLVS